MKPIRARKTMSLKLLALLALTAAATLMPAALASQRSQAGDAGMPAELTKAVNAYRQATIRGDATALSNLVASDYILVNSDSSLQARQSYLDDFELPGFRIDRYLVEQSAHEVWGDTALVRELVHLAWTQEGEQHARGLRIAHLWRKRDGHWQIAYTQLTRVPDR